MWLTDLELGSEDDPSSSTANAGHATHPVRRRIAIKLRHGGKSRSAVGTSGKKTKTKSLKDSTNEGDRTRHNDGNTKFGAKFCANCDNFLLASLCGEVSIDSVLFVLHPY